MGKTAANDVKLIPHRWAMHAVQALAQRDAAMLTRVFTEVATLSRTAAIDTQVKMFGCGAALQFHNFGFFDASASAYSTKSLLDRVVEGDTLLLLALRRLDPECAGALLDCGASLEINNALGETPLEILFDAFAAFQIHRRRQADDAIALELTPAGNPFAPLLSLQPQYDKLLLKIQDRLAARHVQIRDSVEAELDRIYTQHAPERLGKIVAQLADFEYRELELLAGVKRKYEA